MIESPEEVHPTLEGGRIRNPTAPAAPPDRRTEPGEQPSGGKRKRKPLFSFAILPGRHQTLDIRRLIFKRRLFHCQRDERHRRAQVVAGRKALGLNLYPAAGKKMQRYVSLWKGTAGKADALIQFLRGEQLCFFLCNRGRLTETITLHFPHFLFPPQGASKKIPCRWRRVRREQPGSASKKTGVLPCCITVIILKSPRFSLFIIGKIRAKALWCYYNMSRTKEKGDFLRRMKTTG